MSLNHLAPRMYNTDYIKLQETSRSTANDKSVILSDASYEEFILYNLAKDISPTDISINRLIIKKDASFNDISLNLNTTNINIARPSDPNALIDHVLFNNDDSYIQSEKFAMDVKYYNGLAISAPLQEFRIVGPSSGAKINSNVSYNSDSLPLYDANLKMAFTFNNEVQFSTPDNGNKRWQANFDRKFNNMNYFAAINSHLNTNGNVHPFTITPDLSTNNYSIVGESTTFAKYFTTTAANGQPALAPGQRRAVDFSANSDISKNTLKENGLEAEYETSYGNFDGSEFGTYKITQPDSNDLGLLIQVKDENKYLSGEKLPIGQYAAKGTTSIDIQDGGQWLKYEDISKNIQTLHPDNPSKIDSGFTARLVVGNVTTGGYTATSNLFDLNDNDLTTSGSPQNLNYFTNHKARGTHYVDISNGSLTIDESNPNSSFISFSRGEETLDSSFCNVDGKILIKQTQADCTGTANNARVSFLYDLSSDKVTPTGNRSSLTSKVSVYNSTNELPDIRYADGVGYYSVLDNTLATVADVSYHVKLLIESTSNIASQTYSVLDSRNLAVNTPAGTDAQNARLVIANPNKPVDFNIKNNTSFYIEEKDSSKPIRTNNEISILNIQNRCTLVHDGSLSSALTDQGEINDLSFVPGVVTSVDLIDADISTFKYYDYRVLLKTKTAADLSNSISRTNNNWNFALTTLENDRLGVPSDVSGFLLGEPNRISEIIDDDRTFLEGTSNVDITYTFIATPDSNSLNGIKYDFDASSNDPTRKPSFYNKFGGSTNITFAELIDFSNNNLGTVTDITSTSLNFNTTNYIFEKWLRRRQYKAQINPSLPFYANLLLQTETIYEEVFYYRGWTKSSNGSKSFEINSKFLNNFHLSGNTSNTLDKVNIQLVNNFGLINYNNKNTNSPVRLSNPTTTITLKPSDCYIFLANLQGKDVSNNRWVDLGYDASNQVWLTNRASIDPFTIKRGDIVDYNTSSGAQFTCDVEVNFPVQNIVNQPNYYIGVTNKVGSNNALTAHLYTFSYSDICNNSALANYFSSSFSPYDNKFDSLSDYKSDINYSCDLSLNSNVYTLTVKHTGGNNESHEDVRIIFPKDYVLNFNVIYSPKNLLSITRNMTGSSPTVYYDNLTEENVNRIVKVDNGVYLTLNNDVTYGMEEKFALNKDSVNVQFVDNGRVGVVYDPSNGNYYKNNNILWGDVFGTTPLYKPIVFDNGDTKLTIANNANTNKTRSVILNRVRGYNMNGTNNNIDIVRTPAVYKFVLDVSYTIPSYVDTSYGLPVLKKTASTPDPLFSIGSLVYAVPVNDPSRNDPATRYNRAASGDLSNVYIQNILYLPPVKQLYNEEQTRLDPSFNYKLERQIYEQTWNDGVSPFRISNLESTGTITEDARATNTLTGTAPTSGSDNRKIHLDIGLILNPKRSLLSDTEQSSLFNTTTSSRNLIPVNVSAANYSYSFYNVTGANILNGDGSGNLFEGIITNFMNVKSRAVKSKQPFEIKIIYKAQLIRVYYSNTYNTNPHDITNWEQLKTSPFTPEDLSTINSITLHPTILNGPFPIKLRKTATKNTSFKSYLVSAPPAVRIQYNPIDNVVSSLPFTPSGLNTLYYDIKTNSPIFNLRTVVSNNLKVPDDVYITGPTIHFDSYRRMTSETPYKFLINGNNLELSMYSGVSAPQVNTQTYYYDSSLNLKPNPHTPTATDLSYQITVFTDSSNQLVEFPNPDNGTPTTTIYTGAINFIENRGNLYRVTKNGVRFDVSLSQPLGQFLTGITNNSFNINFVIDNAFIPPNTSYLPLKTTKSSSVSFYDSTSRYNNGKYYVFLNKYEMTADTNYQALLSGTTNISTVSFMIDKVYQKAIELFTDGSNIHPLINSKILTNDTNKGSMLVDNITLDDLDGSWNQVSNEYKNIGITLSAIDAAGIEGIRNFLLYDIRKEINHKTIFVERQDIFRVSSAFGEPVFRITNSGNVITPKVTASILSLFQQSVTTRDLFPNNNDGNRTNDEIVLTDTVAKARGVYSKNTLDFSGNVLVSSTVV